MTKVNYDTVHAIYLFLQRKDATAKAIDAAKEYSLSGRKELRDVDVFDARLAELGFVVVPIEPTPEMLQSYIHALDAFHALKHKRTLTWQTKAKMRWRAMLQLRGIQ